MHTAAQSIDANDRRGGRTSCIPLAEGPLA
jgi:hypothetical protein